LLRLGLGLVVVLALAGLWVARQAQQARTHLTAARGLVGELQSSLLDSDAAGAQQRLTELQDEATAARDKADDPVWRLAAGIPRIGATLKTARGLTVAVDELAQRVLPPLVEAGKGISPKDLRTRGNQINLTTLQSAAAPLRSSRGVAEDVRSRVRALPNGSLVLGQVRNARTELLDELDDLVARVRTADAGAQIAPAMLGGSGKRRYLLSIVTPAEGRATGGMIGAYGVIEVDKGKLSLGRLGSNTDLKPTYPKPVVELGKEFDDRYDRFGSDSFWLASNFSPHFPYADAIWRGLWQAQRKEQLDGTIQLDPVGLAYALEVTGPARLPNGETVAGEKIVDILLRSSYARFPDNAVRDAYFQTVARAAYERITSGAGDTKALMSALAKAAGEGHLQIASRHQAEADELATLPIGGTLPEADRPFVQLVTNNVAGSKLDYYLRRTVTHETRVVDGERRVQIVVDLKSTAPTSGLPDYVVARADLKFAPGPVRGQNNLFTSLYVGPNDAFVSATLDGKPLALESETERGFNVYSTYVAVNPGATRRLIIELVGTEAGEPDLRPVRVRRQPLVSPDEVVVTRRVS
jgi:hypothetical protein